MDDPAPGRNHMAQLRGKSLISADAAVNMHGQTTQLLLQTQHIVHVLC